MIDRAHRLLPLLAATILLASCDEARDEYSYKLPEPPPTMAPPTGPVSGTGTPPTPAPSGLPAAQGVDFTREKAPEGMKMRRVQVAGLAFNVPEFWEDTTSGKPMRAAEFRIPSTDDKEDGGDGELVVFHFGAGQGGSADDNIGRWLKQFAAEAGSTPAEISKGEVNGLRVTAVSAFGTYTPAMMGGGDPPKPAPGSGLFGLIVEGGPEGSIFLRATGPARTVSAAKPPMLWLAGSIEKTAGATAEATPEPELQISSGISAQPYEMSVAGLQFSVPSDWKSEPPTSAMRAAQFTIPTGAEPAEGVVFHFGPGQGGSAEDNIARWIGQVKQPDGSDSAKVAKIEKATSGTLTIHQVIVEGTYAGAAMMGAPAEPKPDMRLHGIVVEGGPEGNVFIRLVGRKAHIAVREPEIRWFAKHIRTP